MIKMAQFCNTFNLEFCIIPHTSSALDGVSIRVERKTDKKIYRQILTNAELYGYLANLWLDFGERNKSYSSKIVRDADNTTVNWMEHIECDTDIVPIMGLS